MYPPNVYSIKVLVVDDDPQCRHWTTELLSRREGVTVTGQAGSGEDALLHLRTMASDVVLVDIDMPGMNGIELTTKIRKDYPDTAVVLLSGSADDDSLLSGLTAGACGYLSKDSPNEALFDTIRAARHGVTVLDSSVADRVIERASKERSPRPLKSVIELTPRERVILSQLAQGLSNKAIARAVNLSQKTVRNHLSHIFHKMQVVSRQEALLYALHYGLDRN